MAIILLVLGLSAFFYWGNKKQIWFCDEIYTYESANGFEQEWPASRLDEWMTGEDVKAFFAADSDSLSLNSVTVRLYNDHVPLYFWLFRFVSFFFFKGSSSIWIGLSINLVFYVAILVLGYGVFLYLTRSPLLSGAVMFLTHVSNRLVLEQITTLRMYSMLLLAELLLLLAGLWILREVDGSKTRPGVFFYLFAVSVTGFLTHYDFWIFYAATSALFCMWLLLRAFRHKGKFWAAREFRYVLAWGGNFVCSLLTTIWVFPYCRWNLNRGKGQMALQSVFVLSVQKIQNIIWGYERLAGSIFGELVPAPCALLFLSGGIIGGAVILCRKKEKKKLSGLILVVLTAQLYQLVVCFTLPDAREERYLWGSFTIMMLCMAWGMLLILKELFLKIQNGKVRRKVQYLVSVTLVVGILAGELTIINGGSGIAYLFHPEKDVSVLEEHSEIPWIVYGPTIGVYSYYDWTIPKKLCFLSPDNTEEDAGAFGKLEEDRFILYTHEDYLPSALDFFGETTGHGYVAERLTRSTNLEVYLVERE